MDGQMGRRMLQLTTMWAGPQGRAVHTNETTQPALSPASKEEQMGPLAPSREAKDFETVTEL
jgi:hypothetical protein